MQQLMPDRPMKAHFCGGHFLCVSNLAGVWSCVFWKWVSNSNVTVWILECISFACVQCRSLTNPFISESVWVCVCVYLSGITHSFQTCLSSTLVCVRECVRVCTSKCEIPLSVLKPSLAYCLHRETERGYAHTHSYHTCVRVCFSVQTCVCETLCISFREVLCQVMLVTSWCTFYIKNAVVCLTPNTGFTAFWHLTLRCV